MMKKLLCMLLAVLLVSAASAEKAFVPEIGSVVTFGHYEQDNDLNNGPEPIEWVVLDIQDGEALLISRYALETRPYHEEKTEITWEQCTLRTWLNGEFLQAAFSEEERAAVLLTDVDNGPSQGQSEWTTVGGNNTQDQIFLLSCAEANRYLGVTMDDGENMKSRVASTPYAIAQGAMTSEISQTEDGVAAGCWWLRSPGSYQYSAAYVYADGSLFNYDVDYDSNVVRPAFRLNLEAAVF